MRIINRQTFLALPPGTVYCKYKPMIFDGLYFSHGAQGMSNDWVNQDLSMPVECTGSEDWDVQVKKAERGEEVPLDFECAGRDGLYDPDQLFAVMSKEDVQKLIDRLKDAL